MSYNGSGTFLINSAGQPVVPGTTITTTAFNALTADLASGLTTAMTKDGQTVPTANIPMGGFKLTGLGAGTSATDAAQFGQLQNAPVATLITVSGADTITGTLVQTLTAYATGQQFSFVAAGTNTTAVTLNIDGLGAKAVTRTGAVALAAGALVSGQMAIVEYDGTRFQLINANAFTNLTVSGSLTVGTTLAVTGVATLTAQPILSSLTASLPVFTDASKGLVSNTMTGTGSVMMSASPTTTGTLTAAAINASGLVAMAGAATVGTTLGVSGTSTMAAINASSDVTITSASAYKIVTGGYTHSISQSGDTLFVNGNATSVGSSGDVRVTARAVTIGTFSSTGLSVTGTTSTTTGMAVGGATPGAGGLAFPATAVAVANANTLDDYEEGTWTPVITGSTIAGTGTYSVQNGRYTKIGNTVRIYFAVNWSAHTGTGTTIVTGFPFSSNAGDQTPFAVFTYGETFAALNVANGGFISNGTTQWQHWQVPTGGGNGSGISIYNGTAEMQVSGVYQTS